MTVADLKKELEKYDDNVQVEVLIDGVVVGKIILIDGERDEPYIEVREE